MSRRATRSQRRQDDASQGDLFQQQPQGQFIDTGMGGLGAVLGPGGGVPASVPIMSYQGGMWLPPPDQFLTASFQHHQMNPFGQQQMYGSQGMDVMSQQYQHRQHQEEDQPSMSSSGRTLRARPGPSSAATAATSSNEKRKKGGVAAGGTSSKQSKGSADAPATVESSEDSDEEEGDDGTAAKGKKGSEQSQSVDEMVRNSLYYFLLHQHKKIPVKRSDWIKNALKSQNKQFAEVLKRLEHILGEIFGMRLVRLERTKDNALTLASGKRGVEEDVEEPTPSTSQSAAKRGAGAGKKKTSTSTESFILVSKYPSNVCDSVMRRDPESDSKKTVLYLLLSTVFMLNKPIDEEVIWKIIQEMQLDQMVCEKKEDLRKFLKSEFVSSGYLTLEQQDKSNPVVRLKRSNEDTANAGAEQEEAPNMEDNVRYSWGPRADVEYMKYPMLKFVAARFGRHPYEFAAQYNMIKKSERDLIEKDCGEENDGDGDNNDAADGRNGSALQVRQRTGASARPFSPEGDAETETDDQ